MNKKYQFCLTILKNRGDYAIFSLPQTNQYQEISNLTIGQFNNQVVLNIKGNKVLILNDVKDKFDIKFNALLFSNKTYVKSSFKLTDYHNPVICKNHLVNGRDKKICVLSQNIVGQQQKLDVIMRSLYDFTLGYLTYGKPIEGLYSYHQALEERVTDCGGFSTFLMSLLQSIGIPTRLVCGFLIKDNIFTKIVSNFELCSLNFELLLMHAWFEAQLPDGSWFPIDPSIEWRRIKGLTKRPGGFGYIPADRLVVSYGEDFRIKINNKTYKIDLLQSPIYI